MALVIQKYGGSSVATPALIRAAARRVVRARRAGSRVLVVVSAPGDTTDELLDLAHRITPRPSERELDMLLATGEQRSVALLAMAIHALGEDAISFTGMQIGIMTDRAHTNARIVGINTRRIDEALRRRKIVIVAGFQGVDVDQNITTLGRGGSDLTAVALAKATGSRRCEIYTDVKGVYTADPRVVPDARLLRRISYDEMLELASMGAQVMQARSIIVAKRYNIPICVRSSFSDDSGTWIVKEAKEMEEVLVSGISLDEGQAKVTIRGVPDRPGVAARIFNRISELGLNVDMIIQNADERGRTDVTFTVPRGELVKIRGDEKKLLGAIRARRIEADSGISKVSLVGVGMRTHHGVAARMFECLARQRINIEMISTSEIKISCVVRKKKGRQAVRALHKAFGLARPVAGRWSLARSSK